MSTTRKSKISFSNVNLEQLHSEVETLETNGKYAYGTISHTLWSYSIYLQFHEELAVQEPIFPLNEKNLKAFLLEISKVYTYETVKSTLLNLRRARGIIEKTAILPNSPETKSFLQIIKKNYGENIAGSQDSLQNRRKPLIPTTVFQIVDTIDFSNIGIRDRSILLVNMVLGQRCDSLQYVKLKNIEFTSLDDQKLAIFIIITKEKEGFLETPRKRLISPSRNSFYCPVYSLVLWFYVRGVLNFKEEEDFASIYSNKNISFKSGVENWPCWCNVANSVVTNTIPLQAWEISKRVGKLAVNAGFKKGEITGHSMRKGTATSWILNSVLQSGTYSANIWHDLEQHIGWGKNSEHTKRYVDEAIKLLRDTTNMVVNESPNQSFVTNTGALNLLKAKRIESFRPPNNGKKLPDDLSDIVLSKFWSSVGTPKKITPSLKEENQLKNLTQKVVNEIFQAFQLNDDKNDQFLENYDKKWEQLTDDQKKWVKTKGYSKDTIFQSRLTIPSLTQTQKRKFKSISLEMYNARISSRKAQVRTKLWTMNPIQRLKLYIAIPSIARHVPLIRSPRYLQAHAGEEKDLNKIKTQKKTKIINKIKERKLESK